MPLLSHSTMAAGITADITRFTLLSLLLSFSLFLILLRRHATINFPIFTTIDRRLHEKSTIANIVNAM